ncbi:DUF421 domain-containing protein [Dyadobacter diqingensis]|uniref:DUF421 domain-containing protein n=1 Tax=Dyadobacter diqingensis TaxID=2938121 RepID=UPI0020C2525F|nr:YetF domain-containing protein [Dyadobacter diqingensis]
MEVITDIFGEGKNLNTYHMCLRAAVVFLLTLILIRISGRRSFGMRSPFDNIIVMLLGAILARTVVGASEFIPTVCAAFVIVIMHRLFAFLATTNEHFSSYIKGERIVLYENGQMIGENMKRALVSEKDFYECLRKSLSMESLESIDRAYMECNGEISFVKKV